MSTEPGRRERRLASGVTRSHDYDIKALWPQLLTDTESLKYVDKQVVRCAPTCYFFKAPSRLVQVGEHELL